MISDLPDVLALQLGNDPAGFRELLKPVSRVKQALSMEGGISFGTSCDVGSDGFEVFDRT